jgi:hypothetical protein
MGLPFPGPDDAPCDFDDDWCQFTGAIDAVFAKWDAGLSRGYPAIAAAKMLLTEVTPIQNFNPIPFTEVEFDTAGMTNMDADPYGITIQRAGMYTLAAFLAEDVASGGAGQQAALIISNGGQAFTEQSDILILGAGTYRENVYWPVTRLSEGDRILLTTFVSPQPNRIANSAWLSVAWHSELRRP